MNLSVGILFAPLIRFHLHGTFLVRTFGDRTFTSEMTVFQDRQQTYLQTSAETIPVRLPLLFTPLDEATAQIELTDVVIGIHFHWERKENQFFKGSLQIIREEGHLTAVNILDIEDYLLSVISSEMSATSSLELLKAHAVISRSWLMAQKEKSRQLASRQTGYTSGYQNTEELIRWFDREDHRHFDVCADDHCQRYQGIHKVSTPLVHQAVQETAGEVLTCEGKICDARFSKCCGGISERFENVWEPIPHPYLTEIYDLPSAPVLPDLTREKEAEAWIKASPAAFCNTRDTRILSEVLNDYDQETQQFFRWEVYYTRQELSDLIHEKMQTDLGLINDLIPIERGPSGRIIRLKIIGSENTLTIGKELMIRKALSPTHLYSSAFIVEKEYNTGCLAGFRLKGAGWGHGVGLCQIGAAVMGAQGYNYRQILAHYFPGTTLEKR